MKTVLAFLFNLYRKFYIILSDCLPFNSKFRRQIWIKLKALKFLRSIITTNCKFNCLIFFYFKNLYN